ncbi:hypothetical protein BDZ94DRAFT_1242484, partial [Collybia nuda]
MTSTTFNSDGRFVNHHLGREEIYLFAGTCMSTIIYGIFVLLFVQSASIHFTKKRSSCSQHGLFLITTTIFILATINKALMIQHIGTIFMDSQTSNSRDRAYDLDFDALSLVLLIFSSVILSSFGGHLCYRNTGTD